MRALPKLGFYLLVLIIGKIAWAQEPTQHARLLRFPDISATQIAFVYAGDIYLVGRDGGIAQRLTSDLGQELYPKFSPDGNWIAFSAEYSGARQVYVMPTQGGMPKQLTWYSDIGQLPFRGGTDYRVLDWSPDGRFVLVRANRLPFDDRAGRPYWVPVDGGMEKPLAVPETGGGALSPDGSHYVYTPVEADWRGWKHYRGGRASDVWTYDLRNNVSKRLTDFKGMDMQPVWVKDSIYFASDREYTMNLYSISPEGGEPRKITRFDDYDVLWPSGGPDAVVFEQNGYIWRYDVDSGKPERVAIQLVSDRPQALPVFKKAAAQIESFAISPQGERAAFAARGELFTVPAKNGEPRNISNSPAEREISVSWSPDGKWISYLSDATGEYEIYLRKQDGGSAAKRITFDGRIWKYAPVWSPDSKKLAFADKAVRLHWIDIETQRVHDVDGSVHEDITEYTWSPDSRWIAYTKTNPTRMQAIWLHSLQHGKNHQLTDDQANNFGMAFDPEGRYLYFLSNRDYAGLTYSAYEFNYVYTQATRIYAATLSARETPLGKPKSDEEGDARAAEKTEDGEAANKSAASTPLDIDPKGFDRRVVALNVPAGGYRGLSANKHGVLFLFGTDDGKGFTLRHYEVATEKTEDLAKDVQAYMASADGEKLLIKQGSQFAIIEARPGQDAAKNQLALEKMQLRVDPTVEWRQMYIDAWRILRDWFYDADMHGGLARWETIKARYAPWVEHVATRADLDYVLHEMAGELSAGHIYVERGDELKVERKPGGFIGAEIESDDSGYFKIAKIFPGENWDPAFLSPLTEPGVDVEAGDYILAVDRIDARTVKNFYQLLENKAQRLVELTVARKPDPKNARKVLVRTIASETNVRYLQWVAERRALVDKLSGGKIGYIHLPNTAIEGNRALNQWFAPLAHKSALIIDDRYNGGGFIPDRMIEILARRPLNYWKRRGLELQPTPGIVHDGPKAMLINGLSSSGGDAMPYYFKKLKLGPLIGTRTWGGLIGISGNPTLSDGGSIIAATFRFTDTEGNWAVENEGVAPDVEVIDRPEAIAAGRDPSVEKAVEMLLAELAKHPPRKIVAPPAPTDFGQ